MVPQFIDVEDKIIGPISVRQFVVLLAGVGFMFATYVVLQFATAVFVMVVELGFFVAIAFAKVNGQNLHYFLLVLLQTIKKPGVRIWDKSVDLSDLKKKQDRAEAHSMMLLPKHVTASRLAQLSLIVDTGGAYVGGEREEVEVRREDLI
ncbi:MAG: PrgI family protein [Patescibacteria group bacterium]